MSLKPFVTFSATDRSEILAYTDENGTQIPISNSEASSLPPQLFQGCVIYNLTNLFLWDCIYGQRLYNFIYQRKTVDVVNSKHFQQIIATILQQLKLINRLKKSKSGNEAQITMLESSLGASSKEVLDFTTQYKSDTNIVVLESNIVYICFDLKCDGQFYIPMDAKTLKLGSIVPNPFLKDSSIAKNIKMEMELVASNIVNFWKQIMAKPISDRDKQFAIRNAMQIVASSNNLKRKLEREDTENAKKQRTDFEQGRVSKKWRMIKRASLPKGIQDMSHGLTTSWKGRSIFIAKWGNGKRFYIK